MRYLFIHQNFPGQFRHVAPALAARGHEVVGLGIHRSAEVLQGVRHVHYRVVPPDPVLPRDHPLAEWSSKVARGEAAARAMRKLRAGGFVPDVVVAHPG